MCSAAAPSCALTSTPSHEPKLDGVSAQAIITAILAGERDATVLAALRDRRCRTPLDKIKAALVGDYREEYLFVLRQCQQHWQQLCGSISQCDGEIARRTAALTGVTNAPLPHAPATQRRLQKNMPHAMPVYEEAHRLLGVDLSAIPGVSGRVLCTLMSELGCASHIREKFRSAEAFASCWACVRTTGAAEAASSRPARAK